MTGVDDRPDARSVHRYEAPDYLSRYRSRRGGDKAPVSEHAAPASPEAPPEGDNTPLYLRRFRERGSAAADTTTVE